MEYKKLQIKQSSDTGVAASPEARYWKKFKLAASVKLSGSVNWLEYSPAISSANSSAPPVLSASASLRVELIDPNSGQVLKSLSRFKDVCYSGSFRADGQLVVAGCADGSVQVYEAASRALLRTFLGHEAAVRVTRFSPSVKTIVMSGSDDGSVRGWDVAAERQTLLLHGHRDYVRAGAISSVSPDVWLSGSYDHSVAVWDVRTGGGPVQRLEQGAPVEALLVLPSGSALAVAAGPAVRIWDLVGARPRELLQAHQKAVTCLALDASASRLLAGGLDHLVKIYDVKDWSLAHQLRAPGPLLSLAISAENRHLALGLVDGSLVLRSRSAVAAQTGEAARQRSRRAVLHSGSFRYFMRGKAEQPIQADLRLVAKKRAHLRDYDQYLKAFRYAEALDAALASRQVAVFASMVEELRRRHVFRSSLAGRDETALAPLLRFLVQHLSHPRHASLFLDIAETLLDMYAPIIGQSVEIDELFLALQNRLKREIHVQKELAELHGVLDMLISASVQPPPPEEMTW